MAAFTGKTAIVYGQHEVMRDLFDAAARGGLPVEWNAAGVELSGLDGDRPAVTWRGERRLFG